MLGHRYATAAAAARRAIPTLSLAIALALPTFGPPVPVGVAAESAEPAARLQVVVTHLAT